MTVIKQITDINGNQVYPQTHVGAVVDSNNNTLDTLLNAKANASDLATTNGNVTANATAISDLQALYQGLTQTDIVLVAAADWPLAELQERTVYRVAGTDSYTDYMYDGTNIIPMATYSLQADDEPTENSTNYVTSGGLYNMIIVPKYNIVNLSVLTKYPYHMLASTWGSNGNSKHIVIEVTAGEKYQLACSEAASGGGFYGFLTEHTYSSKGTIPYVSGTSRIWINVGETINITIPVTCNYLCLAVVDSTFDTVTFSLQKITGESIKDYAENIEDTLEESISNLQEEIDGITPIGNYVQSVTSNSFFICDDNGRVVFSINENGESEVVNPVTEGDNKIVTFSVLSPIRFMDNIVMDFIWDADNSTRYSIIRVFKATIQGGTLIPKVDCVRSNYTSSYSARELAIAQGYNLVINCGLGNLTDGDVEGILIQDGEVLYNSSPVDHIGVMPLTIDNEGTLGYADSDADAYDLVDDGIVSAFCGFAPLVVDYEAFDGSSAYQSVPHYNQGAQRQIIGQYDNGDYAIITCEGRGYANSTGWTIPQAQQICIKHGLKFAYNCDGGASTQTVVGHKQINTYYSRRICTYLFFKFA